MHEIDYYHSLGFNRNAKLATPRFQDKLDIKYIGAIGAALRGLDHEWDSKEPYFSLLSKSKIQKVNNIYAQINELKGSLKFILTKANKKQIGALIAVIIILIASIFLLISKKPKEQPNPYRVDPVS